jgi:hypothetical protein
MPLIVLVKIAARIVGAAVFAKLRHAGLARALGLSVDPTALNPLALIASARGRMAGQHSRRLMNSRSTANKAEVVSIQYLRGVAAMSVALFHTSVNMPTFAWPSSLARDFGDCGIDVFFVISGFVMFFVTLSGPIHKLLILNALQLAGSGFCLLVLLPACNRKPTSRGIPFAG